MPRQHTTFLGACAHCRAKKLKCDKNARVCSSCQRARVACLEVDPISGRQYERGYIADLKARVARLRGAVNSPGLDSSSSSSSEGQAVLRPSARDAPEERDAPEIAGGAATGKSASTLPSSEKTPKFSDGSIFSLGHLVAAVLSLQLRNGSGFRIGSLAQPRVPEKDMIPKGDQELPPLAVACELAETYLEVGFHRVSPFIRRRQVFEQIERLYDPRSRKTDKSDLERQNDMFQLFMILAVGAPFSKRRLQEMAPIRYYASAMRYADVLSETTGDVQIQNTLFLLTFSQQHATGIGSKWKLARQAMRTCLQLGYHKASTRPLDPIAEQMRRRLFWCCYVQERYAARGLGRPMVVAESDITIPFPDHVNLDDERNGLVPDPFNRSEVSVLNRQAQLRRISAKVRDELYTGRHHAGGRLDFEHRVGIANRLSEELEQWRLLHAERSTTPYSRCIFETREYMDVNYYRERMFIYSALVVPADSELHAFRPDVKYLRLCLEAAVQVILLYQLMLQRGIQTTLWTWVQDALRSGFMILYCGIHISNMLSDSSATSPTAPAIPEPASIIQALDDCRQMLKDISHKWAAVNPHWVAFDRLSGQVKSLIEGMARPDAGAAGQVAETQESSSMAMGMGMALDDGVMGASGLWDIPMDMAHWDDLMDGDVDMNEVFGFDFNVFAQSALWNG